VLVEDRPQTLLVVQVDIAHRLAEEELLGLEEVTVGVGFERSEELVEVLEFNHVGHPLHHLSQNNLLLTEVNALLVNEGFVKLHREHLAVVLEALIVACLGIVEPLMAVGDQITPVLEHVVLVVRIKDGEDARIFLSSKLHQLGSNVFSLEVNDGEDLEKGVLLDQFDVTAEDLSLSRLLEEGHSLRIKHVQGGLIRLVVLDAELLSDESLRLVRKQVGHSEYLLLNREGMIQLAVVSELLSRDDGLQARVSCHPDVVDCQIFHVVFQQTDRLVNSELS